MPPVGSHEALGVQVSRNRWEQGGVGTALPACSRSKGTAREMDAPSSCGSSCTPAPRHVREDARVARSHVDVLCFGPAWSDVV